MIQLFKSLVVIWIGVIIPVQETVKFDFQA